jgi:hypothetical protein
VRRESRGIERRRAQDLRAADARMGHTLEQHDVRLLKLEGSQRGRGRRS